MRAIIEIEGTGDDIEAMDENKIKERAQQFVRNLRKKLSNYGIKPNAIIRWSKERKTYMKGFKWHPKRPRINTEVPLT